MRFSPGTSTADRLWGRVRRNGDCWEWTGSVGRHGYGQIGIARRTRTTHRVAYELAHGQIPAGLHVRHRCDNKLCVNPDHLEIGTSLDNMRDKSERGRHNNQKKTHCPKRHPYDAINTRIDGHGRRRCRTCEQTYRRARYRRSAA